MKPNLSKVSFVQKANKHVFCSVMTSDVSAKFQLFKVFEKSRLKVGYIGENEQEYVKFVKANQNNRHILFYKPQAGDVKYIEPIKFNNISNVSVIYVLSLVVPALIHLIPKNHAVGVITISEIYDSDISFLINDIITKGYLSNQHINENYWLSIIGEKLLPKPNISNREAEVLKLLCHAYSAKEIALAIGVSLSRVHNIESSLRRKLKCKNEKEVILMCMHNNWIEIDTSFLRYS